jgi:hypothetical protein
MPTALTVRTFLIAETSAVDCFFLLSYSDPRIICEFLTPSPNSRGGLGWGKKFTTPARIAIYH